MVLNPWLNPWLLMGLISAAFQSMVRRVDVVAKRAEKESKRLAGGSGELSRRSLAAL